MWIIPSVAAAAKIFPLWLKHNEVIAGGSLPRGRTVFSKGKKEEKLRLHNSGKHHKGMQMDCWGCPTSRLQI